MLKETIAFGGMLVAVVFGLTQMPVNDPVVVNNPPAVSAPQEENEQGEGQDYSAPTSCQLLLEQQGYTYDNGGGSTVYVPDGVALFEEINEDGHKGMERENICKILVDEYDGHMNDGSMINE